MSSSIVPLTAASLSKHGISQQNAHFEVIAFLKKMMSPERVVTEYGRSVSEYGNMRIKASEIYFICRLAIEEFKKEPNLINVCAPITVVGDVHGNFHDLYRAIMARNPKSSKINDSFPSVKQFVKNRYLFLGNYIEKGSRSIECICLLFALKVCFPNNYFLLRGPYESPSQNNSDFFGQLDFYGVHTKTLQKSFNEAFSFMPLAAIIGKKIFCVHGGISPHLTSWDDIRKIKKPLLDPKDDALATDLLFSDTLDYDLVHIPTSKPKYEYNIIRNISVLYNEAAVKAFCENFGIKLIIRSNMMVPFGHRFFANKKLITIFNSTNFQDEKNYGALLKIGGDAKITVITLLPDGEIPEKIDINQMPSSQVLSELSAKGTLISKHSK